MVEYLVANEAAAGSSPVSRTIFMQINKISLIKALSYRILGTGSTFLISYFLTKNASVSLGIAAFEFVFKVVLYYFHDRIWDNLTKINFKIQK